MRVGADAVMVLGGADVKVAVEHGRTGGSRGERRWSTMLSTAVLAHPPYLQLELQHFVQHYDGPWRWEHWLRDRQRFQAFGWYPATCREERLWGVIPRLTATFVRTAAHATDSELSAEL